MRFTTLSLAAATLVFGTLSFGQPPTPPAPGAPGAEPLAPAPVVLPAPIEEAQPADEPATKAARKFRVVPSGGEAAEVVLFRAAPPPRQFVTVVREHDWTLKDGIILADDSIVTSGSRLKKGQPVPADSGIPGLSIKTDEDYDLSVDYLVLADDYVLKHNVLFPKGFPLWPDMSLAYATKIVTATRPLILKPRNFDSGLRIPDETVPLPAPQMNRELERAGRHRREVTATVSEFRSELSTRPTLGTVDERIANSLVGINNTLGVMDRRLYNVEVGLDDVRTDVKSIKARLRATTTTTTVTAVTYYDTCVFGSVVRHWSNGICQMHTTAGWQPCNIVHGH